MALNII